MQLVKARCVKHRAFILKIIQLLCIFVVIYKHSTLGNLLLRLRGFKLMTKKKIYHIKVNYNTETYIRKLRNAKTGKELCK